MLHEILSSTISEESAGAWWRRRYTGSDADLIRAGRINKAGTPLYDTNWLPAAALLAVVYREMGWNTNRIARTVGKSFHAVSDLFTRIDAAEVMRG